MLKARIVSMFEETTSMRNKKTLEKHMSMGRFVEYMIVLGHD